MATKATKRPRGRPQKDVTADKRLNIRITEDQHARWTAAALRDGFKSLSAWLKSVADKRAG